MENFEKKRGVFVKKIDLTQGKVLPVLVALALPVMGGSVLQFCYSLVDMIWVGRLGTDAVASVGASSFFIGLGYAINALVVVGGGIKVAHKVGAGDERASREYVNASLALNLIVALLYCGILAIFGRQLIGFLDMENAVVVQGAYVYLMWNVPIMFLVFFNTLFARLLQSYGNTKEVFKVNAVGTILNIVLDPILIYAAGMGVAGAAVATLIANVVVFVIYVVRGKNVVGYDMFPENYSKWTEHSAKL